MIKIVPYKKVYQTGIDQLMNEIALEFEEQILSKPTNATPAVPENYWVAMDVDKIIGTVGVMVVENDLGVLKKMMLKKEFRGKELGISKLLLEIVMNWCQDNAVSKLYLGTMDQFKAAQNFYVRHGFQRISAIELPINFLKNPLDCVFFVKDFNH